MTQKIKLTAENEEDLIQDAAHQDHLIGTVAALLSLIWLQVIDLQEIFLPEESRGLDLRCSLDW